MTTLSMIRILWILSVIALVIGSPIIWMSGRVPPDVPGAIAAVAVIAIFVLTLIHRELE